MGDVAAKACGHCRRGHPPPCQLGTLLFQGRISSTVLGRNLKLFFSTIRSPSTLPGGDSRTRGAGLGPVQHHMGGKQVSCQASALSEGCRVSSQASVLLPKFPSLCSRTVPAGAVPQLVQAITAQRVVLRHIQVFL